ncbi:UPF0696 protein C11orf68 homolog [Procambarus clarkii]|uniref:UPF0696 protein C11orf68 homolog n=1 Tax=Procambarus clarkii TaxID=6728 RepID=UPI001E672909|nr:UPF0696 protein C11orf68 homolog [Procambarus clarkii]
MSATYKDANTLAAEAQEQDEGEWITYDAKCSSQSLTAWLKEWAPSKTPADGVGWLCVRGYNVDDSEIPEAEVDELLVAWEDLKESGKPIDLPTIRELAKKYHVTSGKWLLHVDTGVKGDYFWKLVTRGIVDGQLPSNFAKISPNKGPKHVICIYNKDFTNEEQVCSLEKGLRSIGIKSQLSYKPDVYTHIGIYRKNKWKLRPTIYKSDYKITTNQSKITTT